MTIDRDKQWQLILEKGYCNPSVIKESQCVFVHPWIENQVDLSTVELVHGAAAWPFIRNILSYFAPYLVGIIAIAAAFFMPK